jgi:PHD/YefM family antitoxin component YafN of YafNO toxin-antitoxin module
MMRGCWPLAQLKLDTAQNQRLGALQTMGKAAGLTPFEQYELLTLMQTYRLGLLRKSEALAEAKARGLSLNLSS